jgi:hypothetical protein
MCTCVRLLMRLCFQVWIWDLRPGSYKLVFHNLKDYAAMRRSTIPSARGIAKAIHHILVSFTASVWQATRAVVVYVCP